MLEEEVEIVGGGMFDPERGEVKVEVGLFRGCEEPSGSLFWPVAVCPCSGGATLAQCSMQNNMPRLARPLAHAVWAPAAPAKTSAGPQCLCLWVFGLFWFPWGPALAVLEFCPWGYGT